MAYYTEQDRQRAAAKRKINSQFRQLIKTPEDAYDIMGVSVPRVSNRPTLEMYGLPNNIVDLLKNADESYVQSTKSVRRILAFLVTAILAGIFMFFMNQSSESSHPEYYVNGQLMNNFVAWGGALSTIGGLVGVISVWVWASNIAPRQTREHEQYKNYNEQLSFYDYWQRKQSKDHWNNMSGHGFEQAVANLFRNIGFTAEVSNVGGDGGVDIVLLKSSRRIAVQCKRYKSSVGPHVIRDLWGTMNHLDFSEGCIVTTTGFTKGVTNFAHEKGIYLIDLNDILKATDEGGEAHLRRQIGE